jgi:hypothetical protein
LSPSLNARDAKAIVLQLVNPAVALWHLVGEGRLARDDEVRRQLALRPDPGALFPPPIDSLIGMEQTENIVPSEARSKPCQMPGVAAGVLSKQSPGLMSKRQAVMRSQH